VQGAAEAAADSFRLQRARRGQRAVGIHRDERAQRRVAAFDAREAVAHELDRRDPLGPHRLRQGRHREIHRQYLVWD